MKTSTINGAHLIRSLFEIPHRNAGQDKIGEHIAEVNDEAAKFKMENRGNQTLVILHGTPQQVTRIKDHVQRKTAVAA